MAIDPTLAAFVSADYRYDTSADSAVKTAYPQAGALEINTNLGATDGAALALTILNATKTFALVYLVEVEGVLTLDDFAGTVNHYTLTAPLYSTDSRTYKLIAAEVDYVKNTTKLTVRG